MTNSKIKLSLIILHILVSGVCLSQRTSRPIFKEEEAIYGIQLQNDSSTKAVLGKDVWEKHFEADTMFPRIECASSNNKQLLRLFFHYGSTENSVAEFELLYMPKPYDTNKNRLTATVETFISGNGVQLGMSKTSIARLIGNEHTVNKTDGYEEWLYYTTTGKLAKQYNLPAYFIRCRFVKGRLTKYNFGFEYP